MTRTNTDTRGTDDAALSPAVRAGDEAAFERLTRRYGPELHLHCYRMLGSYHDAEDAVQDCFARAWRYRGSVKDAASLRPWLYRIATNACIDFIERNGRTLPDAPAPSADAAAVGAGVPDVAWLQPYPDARLEPLVPREQEPDARLATRETLELAFLAVIQLLTPQQRAALIARDVLGWSAKDAAELLDTSVAAVNSALQRARAALRERMPRRRPEWPAGTDASAAEQELVRRYVEASEREDASAFATILREDAVFRMPPEPGAVVGRDAMIRFWAEFGFGTGALGRFRCVVTRANLRPAVACYTRRNGDTVHRPLAVDVLTIEDGLVGEIVTFPGNLFPALGLPDTV
jgi:RNA polymerase sigma-70 factor (ECF subfamily)